MTIGAAMVVPAADLAASDGALLEVVKQGPLGIPEKLFSAIGLLALSNGALINMIMAWRLLYEMAQEGVLPRPFGLVLSPRALVVPAFVPVVGVAISLALLTQIEAEIFARAGILVAVGMALGIVNWLVVRRQT